MSFCDYNNPKHCCGWVTVVDGKLCLRHPEVPRSERTLSEKREEFFKWLEDNSYGIAAIKNFIWLYNKISKESYRGIDYYNSLFFSKNIKKRKIYVLQIMLFDYYDIYPLKGNFYVRNNNYYLLPPKWQLVVDKYVDLALETNISETTVNGRASLLSSFLCYFHKRGVTNIEQISERMLQDYVKSKRVENKKGHVDIKSMAEIGNALKLYFTETRNEEGLRMCDMFPKGIRPRKVYEPLTEEEERKFEDFILDPASPITFRDRAIGSMMFYYGVRGGDVRNLLLDDIHFDTNRIVFNCNKNRKRLEFTLEPVVGNALYNYFKYERPVCDSEYCFISLFKQRNTIRRVQVQFVINRIFDLIGIRLNGARRGTHILRHNFADRLLRTGSDLGIIQASLGHEDPEVTEGYITANIEQLRKCCLPIEEYPIMSKLYKDNNER